MDTNIFVCEIRCDGKDINPNEILNMGDLFSGSIYYNSDFVSWVQFNLVNKEKMSYILGDINDKPGARFEIQVYVNSSKKV